MPATTLSADARQTLERVENGLRCINNSVLQERSPNEMGQSPDERRHDTEYYYNLTLKCLHGLVASVSGSLLAQDARDDINCISTRIQDFFDRLSIERQEFDSGHSNGLDICRDNTNFELERTSSVLQKLLGGSHPNDPFDPFQSGNGLATPKLKPNSIS